MPDLPSACSSSVELVIEHIVWQEEEFEPNVEVERTSRMQRIDPSCSDLWSISERSSCKRVYVWLQLADIATKCHYDRQYAMPIVRDPLLSCRLPLMLCSVYVPSRLRSVGHCSIEPKQPNQPIPSSINCAVNQLTQPKSPQSNSTNADSKPAPIPHQTPSSPPQPRDHPLPHPPLSTGWDPFH